MQLFLHIGPPKTGSSAIQRGFWQNKDKMTEAGICLFPRDISELLLHGLSTRHNPAASRRAGPVRRNFTTPEAAHAWSVGQWDALAMQVQASDADLCVISSEHLGYGEGITASVANFQEIFSDITVLAYVRDPASLYFSHLQQDLRSGRPLTQLRKPATFRYRFRETIEKYADILGPQNIIVRHFSGNNLLGGDVVQDCFAQLERFGKTVSVKSVRANETPPGAVLALLMLINEMHTTEDRSERYHQIARKLVQSGAMGHFPSFKPDMPWVRALIRVRAAQDCDWLNRTFLSGQVPLPVETGPVPDYPGDTAWHTELRDALLACLTPEALAVLGPEVVRV